MPIFYDIIDTMNDREQKFYSKLLVYFVCLFVMVRCYLWFAGVDLEIPYVNPFLKTTWKVIGIVVKGFYALTYPG